MLKTGNGRRAPPNAILALNPTTKSRTSRRLTHNRRGARPATTEKTKNEYLDYHASGLIVVSKASKAVQAKLEMPDPLAELKAIANRSNGAFGRGELQTAIARLEAKMKEQKQ